MLILPIKKKWFDMIASGEKKEEYREIKRKYDIAMDTHKGSGKKQDKNLEIEIYAKQGKENVILYIKDNGIGIKKGEITRVFEKGFTGTNGRLIGKKSTGIGLYLCKNLCNKLGISIELNSVQDEGTEIRLVFPKSSYLDIQ